MQMITIGIYFFNFTVSKSSRRDTHKTGKSLSPTGNNKKQQNNKTTKQQKT